LTQRVPACLRRGDADRHHRTAASGNPTFNAGLGSFVGTANTQIDVFSLGIRYRFAPPAAAPVVTKG
jgi:hypothetical protein